MILKVCTSDERLCCWRYFDANEVQVCEEAFGYEGPQCDGVMYDEFYTCRTVTEGHAIKIISFMSGGVPHEIATDLSAFLLNDVGQTIERLA